ncbi:MAG: non-canonical purine NTP pyrophosphatase [Bifidobacteriaceae bacterium]|jgi:XTP/dITP diphosphohydrolase|nr:non-canonical purine NTP pyrophosphatase [Bifidobacteriaceae bacterium]
MNNKKSQNPKQNVKLVLGTNNVHKLNEFRSILKRLILENYSESDLSVLDFIGTASDFEISDIPETALTFEDNSKLKAEAVFEKSNLPTLADDSGLIVDILGNAPGILSARWSGAHTDNDDNMNLLLAQMKDIPFEGRSAHFLCCMTLICPSVEPSSEKPSSREAQMKVAVGKCYGYLNDARLGAGGFGYDPIFMPNAYFGNYQSSPSGGRSFADLPDSFKNVHSHRAKATEQLFDKIYKILSE